MKKSFKRVVAATLAVAAMAISSMSICAFAESPSNYYSFSFGGHGGIDFSLPVTKNNDKTYAQVVAENGYLSSTAYITVCVSSTNSGTGTSVSQSRQLTYLSPSEHSLSYTVSRGQGSINYLAGYGSYSGASVNGHWEP